MMPNNPLSDWSHGWAAISAIAATVQVIVVIWWARRVAERSSQKRKVEDGMDQLAKLAIQYPEVETRRLREGFKELPEDDPERIRYENYCILVHNTLEEAYRFEKSWKWGKGHECDVQELITLHRTWLWNEDHNRENLHGSPFGQWILEKAKKGK
jgi:hypothetical protein